uniref:Actin-related protein 2/3 complex subunit 5 n=2 Tax=Phytophthora ramorum TaxID=164328 RepID=H3GBG7_PHYRM
MATPGGDKPLYPQIPRAQQVSMNIQNDTSRDEEVALRNVTHGSTFQCTVCGAQNQILMEHRRPVIVSKMAVNETQIAAGVQARATQVQGLLAQRKNEEAVRAALEDPPLQSKNDAVKDENAKAVMAALLACNKGEMQRAIDSLSSVQEDSLMKYVMRFLGVASQSAAMLEWHQKLSAKAGAGCIMRAFTERKQV